MPGTLYIVATPIGNLSDVSQRALDTLSQVDLIAAEDTRHTRKLLSHFKISKPLLSYHEHNERRLVEDLVRKLQAGESIALVSDAGTPTISDPGFHLVQRCRRLEIEVTPIPGPSAVMAALSASGLPTDRFYFGGFLPVKAGKKQRFLEELRELPATLIFFESPHRVTKTLGILAEVFGERQGVVARELTKIHEEFLFGSFQELQGVLDGRNLRGEVVILVAGAGKKTA